MKPWRRAIPMSGPTCPPPARSMGRSTAGDGGGMTSRRDFIAGLGAAALSATLPLHLPALRRFRSAAPFPLSVLTDEISQDFGHACEIAAREFGLGYVELRAAHGKNIMNWDANDIAEARKVLDRFKLRVSEMASPVFKTDWPGAPKSPSSPKKPQS